MDHEWFKEVGKKLAEIEHQKAQRYAIPSGEIDNDLHRHPSLSSSQYWHRGDRLVPSKCFDYGASRFPRQYVHYVSRETRSAVVMLAGRAYRNDDCETTLLENTKTLIARILLLKLEFLLPQY